jgi:hypothetical protein
MKARPFGRAFFYFSGSEAIRLIDEAIVPTNIRTTPKAQGIQPASLLENDTSLRKSLYAAKANATPEKKEKSTNIAIDLIAFRVFN